MDPYTTGLILLLVGLLLYKYVWSQTKRFERLGVAFEPPVPILGNLATTAFGIVNMGEHIMNLYNQFSHLKYFGFFNILTPAIFIRDPELLTSITVKNFDHFVDHVGLVDADLDPLMGKNLFQLRGDKWRDMRKILSPAFTSSKMKVMSQLIIDCADRFTEFIATDSKTGREYDLWNTFRCYLNDVVATCSYGITIDSMRNPDNQFYRHGKNVTVTTRLMTLKLLMALNFRFLFKFFGIKFFSEEVHQYFRNVIIETVKMREEKGIQRPDMVQLMMESRDKDGNRMSIDDMTSQAFAFFLGGFDTTSSLICFALYEIGVNPEIEPKVLAEIEEVNRKYNGKLSYGALRELTYTEAVLDEVNRMYVAPAFLDRVCVKEFELPPAGPGFKPVKVIPGDVLCFSPSSMHHDPNYYPEPSKFRPERFLNGEVQSSTYMPFGMGPRSCIGNRFAVMQVKIVLFYLLQRCKLEPSDKTMIPMKLSKSSAVPKPEKGFWLNIKARDDYSAANGDACKDQNGLSSTK